MSSARASRRFQASASPRGALAVGSPERNCSAHLEKSVNAFSSSLWPRPSMTDDGGWMMEDGWWMVDDGWDEGERSGSCLAAVAIRELVLDRWNTDEYLDE